MDFEGIEFSETRNARALARSNGGEAKEHGNGATGWIGVGLGVGAAVTLAVLRSKSRGASARALTLAGAAVTGAALLDTLYLVRKRGFLGAKPSPISVRTSVTIRRPRDEVYRFWRNLENLPAFMRHVDSVTESNGHSVWQALGPGGIQAEWEAEIVANRPGERIAWRSLEGSTIPNQGSVEFRDAPKDRGTEVHLELAFEPPGGSVGAGIARFFAELPELTLYGDLRRLKQLLETGEIVCSDASIHRGPHPARPPESDEAPVVNGRVRS